MNRLTLAFLLALPFTASALAQPGPRGGDRDEGWQAPTAEQRVARMSRHLGLDDQQAGELTELFQAVDAEREAVREEHHQQARQDLCAMQSSIREQVREILTPEQAAQFDEMMLRKQERIDEGINSAGNGEEDGAKHRRPNMNCKENGV